MLGGALATKSGVIAVVEFDFVGGFVDEESFGCDLVKKVDVVRNDEDGTMIMAEKVSDELFGFDVEMICRFVEKENAGVFEEDACEGDF